MDEGDESQYEYVTQIISDIKTSFQNDGNLAFQYVPGNHDLCKNGSGVTLDKFNEFIQANYVNYQFTTNKVIIQDYKDISIILANSVSHGDITYSSIPVNELKIALQNTCNPFIVITHHSLFGDNNDDVSMIRNSSEISALMQTDNFVGFLHGHTHGYKNIMIENCRLIGVGPFIKDIPNVPNQFNLIKIYEGKIFSIYNYTYRTDYCVDGHFDKKLYSKAEHKFTIAQAHMVYGKTLLEMLNTTVTYTICMLV